MLVCLCVCAVLGLCVRVFVRSCVTVWGCVFVAVVRLCVCLCVCECVCLRMFVAVCVRF